MTSPSKTNKTDLYSDFKHEYVSPRRPAFIDVSPARYLSVGGRGKPGGGAFEDATGALYSAAFTTKMMLKAKGRDYTVCKLEALWWIDGGAPFEKAADDQVHYTLLIRTPDFVDDGALGEAKEALRRKGKSTEHTEKVEIETLQEGRCVQMLHVGPYATERATLDEMTSASRKNRLELCGRHHEIYLSDPRRVPPESLKTILRHPVRAMI
ncbi:GyrI-like domain-containing protein [Pendulispora albinea]|uniref:GyrI-like domain-containing protein n=1 Tax=Pendulispora albinea TaxID=2741071 RepID=A0ABZ2MCB9_9BACT